MEGEGVEECRGKEEADSIKINSIRELLYTENKQKELKNYTSFVKD